MLDSLANWDQRLSTFAVNIDIRALAIYIHCVSIHKCQHLSPSE